MTSRLTVAHSNQLSYERRGRATKDRTRDNWSLATKRIVIIIQNYNPMLYQLSYRTVMPTGFEPALFRTRALIWRLRPLGHIIFVRHSTSKNPFFAPILVGTFLSQIKAKGENERLF